MEQELSCPVTLGQTVRFDPWMDLGGEGGKDYGGKLTTGIVVSLNPRSRWFSVAYGSHRVSFSFSQVGKKVLL